MIELPAPELQIDFARSLKAIRSQLLQEALLATVQEVSLHEIDAELRDSVREVDLKRLAVHGLRGELLFPVPCLLRGNPSLLGYYRLLLGFSQKAFYGSSGGAGQFKSMEDSGTLSSRQDELLPDLCAGMNRCASLLLAALDEGDIQPQFLDDLTLLTLGPQLRGGANVRKGSAGIVVVFDAIREVVKGNIQKETSKRLDIHNASGRSVTIQCAADPDIVIVEAMAPEEQRNVIAIEVKSGTDFSNIHNRIGEAEKSHQKARQAGFVECWTIVNVDNIDLAMARRESPSTNRFYRISGLKRGEGDEFRDFRSRVLSLVGIPG
ncbi:MAG: XcyI family restriction endonuclease [Deltaproteobacteria bacterium]|nr:XcyI family restriction endonuclease [Deltaproteobacteria bacterium]